MKRTFGGGEVTMRNPERRAMFEFARKVADPGFRKILHDHGCRDVQDVVVTVDDTPVREVLDRIFTRARPPALVALHRPGQIHGFVFLTVEPVIKPGPAPDAEQVSALGEGTSIGMLYDSLPMNHRRTFQLGDHFQYKVQPLDPELVAA